MLFDVLTGHAIGILSEPVHKTSDNGRSRCSWLSSKFAKEYFQAVMTKNCFNNEQVTIPQTPIDLCTWDFMSSLLYLSRLSASSTEVYSTSVGNAKYRMSRERDEDIIRTE